MAGHASALVWASGANRVLSAGTQVVVGFMLQPEQLGEFALAMALVGLLSLFQAADLSRVALQAGAAAAHTAGRIRNTLLTGSALTALLALGVAAALGLPLSPWLLLPLALMPLLRVMNNTRVVLLSQRGAGAEVAGATAAEGLVRAVCVVGLALAGLGPLALVAGEVAAVLVAALWLSRLERAPHVSGLALPADTRRRLVQAGVASQLSLVEREFPLWLAGALCSVAAVGHLAFAGRVAGQLTILLVPLLLVQALPALLHARQAGAAAYAEERASQVRQLLRWGLPLALLLGLVAPAAMWLLWGERWAVAAALTPVAVLTAAVRLAMGLRRAELEAMGRFGDILRLNAGDALTLLLVLPPAAWWWDVAGVAAGALLAALLTWWRAVALVRLLAPESPGGRAVTVIDANGTGHRAGFQRWIGQIEGWQVQTWLLGEARRAAWNPLRWLLQLMRRPRALRRCVFTTGDPFLPLAPLLRLVGAQAVFIVHRRTRFLQAQGALARGWRACITAQVCVVDATQLRGLQAALPNARCWVLSMPIDAGPAPASHAEPAAPLRVGVIGGTAQTRLLHELLAARAHWTAATGLAPPEVVFVNAGGDAAASLPGVVHERRNLDGHADYLDAVAGFRLLWTVRESAGSYLASTALEALCLGVPALVLATDWSRAEAERWPLIGCIEPGRPEANARELQRLLGMPRHQREALAAQAREAFDPARFQRQLAAAWC